MVQQSVVVAREDTPGDRRLVVLWVATDGSSPSAHDVRSYLHQKLPDYMVPSTFVFLDSLPFTPNGKVDRKALPAPDQDRTEFSDAFAAPRHPVAKNPRRPFGALSSRSTRSAYPGQLLSLGRPFLARYTSRLAHPRCLQTRFTLQSFVRSANRPRSRPEAKRHRRQTRGHPDGANYPRCAGTIRVQRSNYQA